MDYFNHQSTLNNMADFGFKPGFIPSAPTDSEKCYFQPGYPNPPGSSNPPPYPSNRPFEPPAYPSGHHFGPPGQNFPPHGPHFVPPGHHTPPYDQPPPPPSYIPPFGPPRPLPGPPSYMPPSQHHPAHPVSGNAVTTAYYLPAYYWVDTHAWGGLPSTALHGGVDQDGEHIYVGRAYHEGDWIPAKVIPGRNVAYVAYNGAEHAKDSFQVLCEQRFDWVPSNGGYIPQGAVEGGRTSEGEPLYIGRVHHEGSCTVGKVHPSHRVCYIPFGGREIAYDSYEILVLRR